MTHNIFLQASSWPTEKKVSKFSLDRSPFLWKATFVVCESGKCETATDQAFKKVERTIVSTTISDPDAVF